MSACYNLADRVWCLAWHDRRTPARTWIRRALDRLGVPLDQPPPPGNLGAIASLLRLYQCAPADDREYPPATALHIIGNVRS